MLCCAVCFYCVLVYDVLLCWLLLSCAMRVLALVHVHCYLWLLAESIGLCCNSTWRCALQWAPAPSCKTQPQRLVHGDQVCQKWRTSSNCSSNGIGRGSCLGLVAGGSLLLHVYAATALGSQALHNFHCLLLTSSRCKPPFPQRPQLLRCHGGTVPGSCITSSLLILQLYVWQ